MPLRPEQQTPPAACLAFRQATAAAMGTHSSNAHRTCQVLMDHCSWVCICKQLASVAPKVEP